MKRGQITLFIIVGFFILAAFAFVFHIANTMNQEGFSQDTFERSISMQTPMQLDVFFETCLQQTTDTALLWLVERGGQGLLKAIRTPQEHYAFPIVEEKLYAQQGGAYYPLVYIAQPLSNGSHIPLSLVYTNEQLASEIAFTIERLLPVCYNGFDALQNVGDFEYVDQNIDVVISDNYVVTVYHTIEFIMETGNIEFFERSYVYQVHADVVFFNEIMKEVVNVYADMAPNQYPQLFVDHLFSNFELQSLTSQDGDLLHMNILGESIIYDDVAVLYKAAFMYDWNNMAYVDPSIPVHRQTTWDLGSSVSPFTTDANYTFEWDISGYFDDPYTDYFSIVSHDFVIEENLGIIIPQTKFYAPGTYDVMVRGYSLENTGMYREGKFRIVVETSQELPYILPHEGIISSRGFWVYEQVHALGSAGQQVLYELYVPDTLANQPCDGFVQIDPTSGEIIGFITAPEGLYDVIVRVAQINPDDTFGEIAMTIPFEVRGGYRYSCE